MVGAGAAEPETITIGSQVWMARNLDVVAYRNGDPIPLANNDREWRVTRNTTEPMSRIFADDEKYRASYGVLYNWAVVTDARGICPAGFRVPSQADWQQLFTVVGDPKTSAGKFKSKTGWDGKHPDFPDRDWNGSDDYGFAALSSRQAQSGGGFPYTADMASFWSTTSVDNERAYLFNIIGIDPEFSSLDSVPKWTGGSVRCLKE